MSHIRLIGSNDGKAVDEQDPWQVEDALGPWVQQTAAQE